ncbi:hypothetical protein SSP24_09890 [Streptomyces spinoverrucosus]|uniref:Uncharacterized protein n=1 Tax=Streptomyces spinoverrucosus TaxID=284043 RepID=A0A4Y3V8Z8_9ACTN|nr:hypothetical protein SSP24_09890 [Streptomyces spinoverrucosus]GHB36463.1 hypothetical protein GCM10010397_02680 [Streptomyces spinoverrucosus]
MTNEMGSSRSESPSGHPENPGTGVCAQGVGAGASQCFGQEARPWERPEPTPRVSVRTVHALPR